MPNPPFTLAELTSTLTLTPPDQTGTFFSAIDASPVGKANFFGFVSVPFNGRTYKLDQLRTFYLTGEWVEPKPITDPNLIAMDGMDLPKPKAGRPRKSKPSGYAGVTWCQKRGLWWTQLRVGGKTHTLGYFETPIQGYEARLKALQNFSIYGHVKGAGATSTSRPSRIPGVYWYPNRNRWLAKETSGERRYMGLFKTEAAAAAAMGFDLKTGKRTVRNSDDQHASPQDEQRAWLAHERELMENQAIEEAELQIRRELYAKQNR